MTSTTSQIIETIREELLDESQELSTVLVESNIVPSYETAVKLNNPFAFDIKRYVPNQKVMDLDRFFEVAKELIEDDQKRDGIVDKERVLLVEDYPHDEIANFGDEVITFKVLKREPARMDAKATSRPQRKALASYSVRSARHPNKIADIKNQPIDHRIEFTCWSKSARLANKRVMWLEKLFKYWSWVFKIQGAAKFHWESRGPDTMWSPGGQRIHQRSLVFFLRLIEFEVIAHPIIKSFELEVTSTEEM